MRPGLGQPQRALGGGPAAPGEQRLLDQQFGPGQGGRGGVRRPWFEQRRGRRPAAARAEQLDLGLLVALVVGRAVRFLVGILVRALDPRPPLIRQGRLPSVLPVVLAGGDGIPTRLR
ncbi:hypothetical protein GXW82_22025 [Streptacidiphilus sp. 4-A2]|nr:hypothetical protein [Streptacidiphilus sp. 4-A2]